MDTLEATLCVYMQTNERIKLDVKHNMTSYNHLLDKKQALHEVNVALQSMNVHLKTLSKNQLQKFAFENDWDLRYIWKILKQIRHKTTGPLVKSIFDDILQFEDLRSHVTEVFDAFIHGITYFHNDLPADPVSAPLYHHPKSCGARSEGPRTCSIHDDAIHLKKNKKLAYLCYLERLIYDKIHTRYNLFFPKRGTDVESAQDEGHIEKINRVEKDFTTCFPNLKISVEIEFGSLNGREYPTVCRIYKSSKRLGQVISTQTYKRNLNVLSNSYDELYRKKVYSQILTKNSNMYNVQSFANPNNKWLKTTLFFDRFFKVL